ncbi:MAG TPA: 5-(carboxyamino)imidazole ribonucleotide mutase [Verrucomicrobiales bacterium]|nr:5-(carboxyamino)imidazole ribonucleotide mutase [Pedosphaera sp.]HAO67099.1 5-(carboxyamino)imidazole ribonucleotide mutase [Verrucomicrobiales bacterium]HAQ98150.1 5-(carboxyamino)imidazole ribonucleotide mutase [Verrucomicrobiales bacterium]HBP56569.1 5-(carboxyamino)imidazole ribonucleotide mutase [Verrucomicrobiales bacterium]HCP36874.1 5-(carboxyamino)imidazole ribonucleotide mutase [Verrucomicrobiales bacterium]|tara:strand:- start:2091 stop:2600 length:510 start_codon:yes stop_codon:yes gene_type:complete
MTNSNGSSNKTPLVGIIMGSDSDWPTMKAAANICAQFNITHEARVISAHRTPHDMGKYGDEAHTRGMKVIIAGAGGAAHLPGMIASYTPLPVIGVPVQSKSLNGLDSLLSIVQMPGGIPVATVAIGNAKNAGLLAISILATSDECLRTELLAYKKKMAEESRKKTSNLI